MPASGGAADKLGNRYEALWAIDQLLRAIDGAVSELVLQPLDPDESRGIEFLVKSADGAMEYWSVKRQTTEASGWTLRLLTAKDDRGRSILGDLLRHVEREPTYRGVFASALGARDFEELRSYSESSTTFDARLAQSSKLTSAFSDYLVPLCDGSPERARALLLRARTHAVDETQLRGRVDFAIRKLLYAAEGLPLDIAAVRGLLAELLLDNIHRPLNREMILGRLAAHGVRLREWAVEKSVRDRVEAICEAYVTPLRSQLINDTLLSLTSADSILGADGKPLGGKVLVVGVAGGGKSSILAGVVDRLRGSGIPVLTVRFDQLPEGMLSTAELGRKLLLPESPALVLAGLADGTPSVLVIDQLDAVSIASGRHAELWSLFEELRREAERLPGLSLMVGCREFDLEHDHRMRSMKATSSGFVVVELQPLSIEQVDDVLRDAGTDPTTVQSTLKPILVVPLHLSMFLSLSPAYRQSVRNRDELFDTYWTEAERRVRQRLGRKPAWTQVIDGLVDWLSSNQQLSAPRYVLDEVADDATAMASERVLILTNDRYRFFHESFFDYAFARRFAARGGRLIDLLLGSEQHLFRRAQVRQVLAYLRVHDQPRYLQELESVLTAAGVRFHIKHLVLQWLTSLPDPQHLEWAVLQRLSEAAPDLHSHVRGVMAGHPGWFDVLDKAIFFDAALSSGDAAREQEAVWLLRLHSTLETRSGRVAELLSQYRKLGEPWDGYLRYVCRNGEVYHSREMFDLFLALIDDGTLDLRPGFAMNDDWWSTLYSMAHKRPDLACEAIGHWFDRALVRWRDGVRKTESAGAGNGEEPDLATFLDRSGSGAQAIEAAAGSPLAYVEQMLPRVAQLVNETVTDCGDRLQVEPLWSFRCFGESMYQVHEAILYSLGNALEVLAKTQPQALDRLLGLCQERSHDAIAYLVLRAWTAAPEVYADRLAGYLTADPRRLKVGYAVTGGGGGSAALYVSSQAVKAASERCSPECFAALEGAILALADDWEGKHPEYRGRTQWELLESLEVSRLGAGARARLQELRRKFTESRRDPPRAIEATWLGPPLSDDAQTRMSDDHWLRAMRKYADVERRRERDFGSSGGERELAGSLQARAKAEPSRFAALAQRMPEGLPATYFEAIIRGVADRAPANADGQLVASSCEQVISLVRRAHALPNRPCGGSIAWLVEKWVAHCDWPEDVIDAVAWYAVSDPDPREEVWRIAAAGGSRYYGGDPHMAGINSTRGAIADAIARLLFDGPDRLERLNDAVYSLAHDPSVAVRSCAIKALLAVLNVDIEKAILWFIECVAADPVLLETAYAERFIHFAGYRNYPAVRPVIDAMLGSAAPAAVEAGARQVCLLALSVEAAEVDLTLVHSGTEPMRKSAASVYAANIAEAMVGSTCRRLLRPFFADQSDAVRAEAAMAFRNLANLPTSEQAELLAAFLDTAQGPVAWELVVGALESSPVQLPELVCRLAEGCVEAYRAEAGDISKTGPAVARDLSKIVVRLYAQVEDSVIQTRCLNLIDEMEQYDFFGLSDELRRLER